MLSLHDFFHLPRIDDLVAQLVEDEPGVVVVAGTDARPATATGDSYRPGGRTTFFRILMREFLMTHEEANCIVVSADKSMARTSRSLRHRVHSLQVEPPYSYADLIFTAAIRHPGLLVIDHLAPDSVAAAFEAARRGVRVLTQLDTVFRGAGVARQLLDWGAEDEAGLTWVVTVQRMATLCDQCRVPASAATHERLGADVTVYEPGGCERCHASGRHGEVTLFDFYRRGEALLHMQDYAGDLALAGLLSADDALHFEANHLRHVYSLLAASESDTSKANAALRRKVAELESANKVLEQRTRALVSLQSISQALISSTDLDYLAARVCQHARDLCGAERVALYFQQDGQAEMLAVLGWDQAHTHRQLPPFDVARYTEPKPYHSQPPGLDEREFNAAGVKAGLLVPLIAEGQSVGAMIVHSAKKSRFAEGEVALLQTFASHASLAIQRASLIQRLREKIRALQDAQAELAQKERLEKELELAREVQRNVIPQTFAPIPGFHFAARYEPARKVGGDFYDVFVVDDDHFGVVIGDVSGKGMPAALYMALTRSLLLAEARRALSPREVLFSVNALLREIGQQGMFVTVFYGVIDVQTRRLRYVRAGHDHPLLLQNGDINELRGEGVVLGLLNNDMFFLAEQEVDLAPGDRLVLYTDGLTDIEDDRKQMFELAKLKKLVRAHTSKAAVELCNAIFKDLNTYRGKAQQFDDMTLLVVEVD